MEILYLITLQMYLSLKKFTKVQYYSTLAITEVIRGSSRENLQKLGLEHLHHRRWMRCLSFFHKVPSYEVPKYIHDLILFYQTLL